MAKSWEMTRRRDRLKKRENDQTTRQAEKIPQNRLLEGCVCFAALKTVPRAATKNYYSGGNFCLNKPHFMY